MSVLSIDPGLWKSGCALWTADGRLKKAWTARHDQGKGPEAWRSMASTIAEAAGRPTVVVCEVMQIDARSKGKEANLLQLSGVVGAVAMRFSKAKIVGYRPQQWKNTMPKRVSHARLKDRLSPAELASIEKRSTHDTWDAIGIGAYYFRTLGESRWLPRR